MSIKELRLERVRVVENPTWDVVEAALRSLDGQERDGIVLQRDNQSYMGISGGEDNQCAIIGYLEGFGEYVCASGVEDGPAQDVAVAGDYNSFESKHVIELEKALLAAKAFFERGVLSEQLKWEKEE
jgi:hypothetical protein